MTLISVLVATITKNFLGCRLYDDTHSVFQGKVFVSACDRDSHARTM